MLTEYGLQLDHENFKITKKNNQTTIIIQIYKIYKFTKFTKKMNNFYSNIYTALLLNKKKTRHFFICTIQHIYFGDNDNFILFYNKTYISALSDCLKSELQLLFKSIIASKKIITIKKKYDYVDYGIIDSEYIICEHDNHTIKISLKKTNDKYYVYINSY